MNATKSLRQLLDEHGVEWEEPDPYQDATAWVGSGNIEYVAHEGISFDGPTGRLILFCLTPEQAVEATLGRGTCYITDNGPWGYPYVCSACGASFDPDVNGGEFNFCPNCGRRVES